MVTGSHLLQRREKVNMPRAMKSAAAGIIAFFRKAPMENAELVLDLCKDEIKQRKAHGENIRAAQQAAARKKGKVKAKPVAAAAASPAAAKGKKRGPKPGSKRRGAYGAGAADHRGDLLEDADPGETTAPPPQ